MYYRLVDCFDLVRKIAGLSNISILNFQVDIDNEDNVRPSDVYGIAKLLVSELAYLHQMLYNKGIMDTDFTYYRERKYPSHVYQCAGILEAQLEELNKWVIRVAHWMGGEKVIK